MKALNILTWASSVAPVSDRARALERLGHTVTHFDPRLMPPEPGGLIA